MRMKRKEEWKISMVREEKKNEDGEKRRMENKYGMKSIRARMERKEWKMSMAREEKRIRVRMEWKNDTKLGDKKQRGTGRYGQREDKSMDKKTRRRVVQDKER